jgi:hypothetical protein
LAATRPATSRRPKAFGISSTSDELPQEPGRRGA